MDKLDLHEMTVDEALKCFIPYYNSRIKNREAFYLIHGYGSTGTGGKIMRRLRQMLEQNKGKVKFTFGEDIDGNPATPLFIPLRKLLVSPTYLENRSLPFAKFQKYRTKSLANF